MELRFYAIKNLLNISKIISVILQTFVKFDCILIYLCREIFESIEQELLFIQSST